MEADATRGRRRLCCRCCCGQLVVLGVAAVVALVVLTRWYGEYVRVARTLPSELAAARREGLALIPADLRRSPSVPPDQNAAPIYRRIHALFGALGTAERKREEDVRQALRGGAASPKTLGLAARLLSDRAPILRLARQAARLQHCDFERPYEQGPNLLLTEPGSLRRLAQLLAIEAQLASAEGRVADAFEAIHVGGRVARHVAEEPILISCLVSIAIDAIMDRAFQGVVLGHKNDPRIVALATTAERSLRPAPDFGRALSGEVVCCRIMGDILRRERPDHLGVGSALPWFAAHTRARAAMVDAWEARSVAYWRAIFSALHAHEGDLMAQHRACEPITAEAMRNDGKRTYEMGALMMPVFAQAILKVAGNEAQRGLRAALVDLVSYRQKHGDWPATLADLPSRPPDDLFSGRPFIYRRTSEGFVLYSVGENLKDDGGRARDPATKRVIDFVVSYPIGV